jgi:hypothetical protein
MTPTQEARDLVWLVLNASPRSNMDDLARGVQAIIDAAEERGKRMALEAAAKVASDAIVQHCITGGRCSAGDHAAVAFNAICQIDPAALGAE